MMKAVLISIQPKRKKQCEKCVATLEKIFKEVELKDKYIAYLQRKLDETGTTYRKEFKEKKNEN